MLNVKAFQDNQLIRTHRYKMNINSQINQHVFAHPHHNYGSSYT